MSSSQQKTRSPRRAAFSDSRTLRSCLPHHSRLRLPSSAPPVPRQLGPRLCPVTCSAWPSPRGGRGWRRRTTRTTMTTGAATTRRCTVRGGADGVAGGEGAVRRLVWSGEGTHTLPSHGMHCTGWSNALPKRLTWPCSAMLTGGGGCVCVHDTGGGASSSTTTRPAAVAALTGGSFSPSHVRRGRMGTRVRCPAALSACSRC